MIVKKISDTPCSCGAAAGEPCADAQAGSYHRDRWAHALDLKGGAYDDGILAHVADRIALSPRPSAEDALRAEVAALKAQVAALKAQVAAMTKVGNQLRDACQGQCAVSRAWDAVRGLP